MTRLARVLAGGPVCLALAAGAAGALAAQRGAVPPTAVKVGDTGYFLCSGNIPAFAVTLNGGLAPRLEITVILKSAPAADSAPLLRFDLIDAEGKLVEMADSLASPVDSGPPWFEVQEMQDSSYSLSLLNRRPAKPTRPFRVRVSLDSTKIKADSRTFQLYWTDLNQPLCKTL